MVISKIHVPTCMQSGALLDTSGIVLWLPCYFGILFLYFLVHNGCIFGVTHSETQFTWITDWWGFLEKGTRKWNCKEKASTSFKQCSAVWSLNSLGKDLGKVINWSLKKFCVTSGIFVKRKVEYRDVFWLFWVCDEHSFLLNLRTGESFSF